MKPQAAAIALLLVMAMPSARTEETGAMTGSKAALTYEDVRKVAPALEAYTQNRLLGDVWKRPGLAPRDRSIVTLAALIARNQSIEMPYHFNLALDNGVKPREISEIITHLAFYAGWANAMSAVAVAKDVFAAMLDSTRSAAELVAERGLGRISDVSALDAVVSDVVRENPSQVSLYKSGKTQTFGWFVGQVMKRTGGRADPAAVRAALERALQGSPAEP